MEGAVSRVRPKMMTVSTTIIGLLPVMWSVGSGSEAMKRIAAPMVGGMVSEWIARLGYEGPQGTNQEVVTLNVKE